MHFDTVLSEYRQLEPIYGNYWAHRLWELWSKLLKTACTIFLKKIHIYSLRCLAFLLKQVKWYSRRVRWTFQVEEIRLQKSKSRWDGIFIKMLEFQPQPLFFYFQSCRQWLQVLFFALSLTLEYIYKQTLWTFLTVSSSVLIVVNDVNF